MEALPRVIGGLYLPSYFSGASLAPGVQVENWFPSFVLRGTLFLLFRQAQATQYSSCSEGSKTECITGGVVSTVQSM